MLAVKKQQRGKKMAHNKKNIYYELLLKEIFCGNGIEVICKEIGENYVTESNALCWLEQGQTEKTIISMLRKLDYNIPKDVIGSNQVFGRE